MSLPQVSGSKKKKKRGRDWEEEKKEKAKKAKIGREGEESSESEWRVVRSFIDPNPQLKGVAPGKYAPKVAIYIHVESPYFLLKLLVISQTLLEEKMDECIERGEFREAVQMSEKLAQREVKTRTGVGE